MQLILASSSPRRRELLTLLQIPFEVVEPDCEETIHAELSAKELVQDLARQKAEIVSRKFPDAFVIGGDTLIEIDDELLGKPQNLDEAGAMLKQLQGRRHQVHTGVALVQATSNTLEAFVETAQVWIKSFSDHELVSYLNTEESLGKAGAYSIQGEGAQLIEKIEGDYPTVVGLPLWHTAKLLEQVGVMLPNSVEEIYRLKPYANWKDFTE